MEISICGHSALMLTRYLRSQGAPLPCSRVPIAQPDPYPRARWSAGAIDLSRFGDAGKFSVQRPLHVAVAEKSHRLRIKAARNTIYSHGLPERPMLDLGGGVSMSCPELLFVEMGRVLDLTTHLMLALELCGTFSRDATNPRDGSVTYGIQPACSVQSIGAFLRSCKDVVGVQNARRTLSLAMNNAWSSTEALIACLMRLPASNPGYEFGSLLLNDPVRKVMGDGVRIPDIVVAGTHVGINYDGGEHLDLDSLERAMSNLHAQPGDASAFEEYERQKRAVRAKYVDDRRRDRDLMTSGYHVLTATKEDLQEEGGLDRLMHQVISAIEHETGRSLELQRKIITNPVLARERQQVLWSLLSGRRARQLFRESREMSQPMGPVYDELILL